MRRLRAFLAVGLVTWAAGACGADAFAAAGPAAGIQARGERPAIAFASVSPADSTGSRPGARWVPPRRRAVPDTSRPGGSLLESLQRTDAAFYDSLLLRFDAGLRDSVVAEWDSLGLEALTGVRLRAGRRFLVRPRVSSLTTYNRVEGGVAGPALEVLPWGRRGPRLRGEVAYAWEPHRWRGRGALLVPLGRGGWEPALEAEYADRVVPYGFERRRANGIRALLAGSDEQDYLWRRGWAAFLRLERTRRRGRAELRLGYEAARETSVPARTEAALVGRMESCNAPVDEGTDRAVAAVARWSPPFLYGVGLEAEGRTAGGALGGDFGYRRLDVGLRARRYLAGGHEVTLHLRGAATGGSPPVQRLVDAGGRSTVRGWPRRARAGRRGALARLEYFLPYDPLGGLGIRLPGGYRVQGVLWADGAWVEERTAGENAGEAWIASAGFGLQVYLGPFPGFSHARLDVAFPLGPDRPEDVVVYLRALDLLRGP